MLKNIQPTITLPSPPVFDGELEQYVSSIDKYSNDLQRALEDYTRTLADNIVEQPRFDDFRVPLTRDKQGQTDLPNFDFTNLGLLFPQNKATEIIYLINQIPHTWKIGTPLLPHVHFLQTGSDLPIFKMDYKLYDNGSILPSSWTTIETNTTANYTYDSGTMLQILDFPEINTSHIKDVSAFLDVRFYRDDNVVSGDVTTKEWDFHYQVDSLGSREEYIK